MKQVALCVTVLIACSTPRVDAKTAAVRCTPQRETIQSGDRAVALAVRSGVRDDEFARWLAHVPASSRRELTHLHPGDTFEACISPAVAGQTTLERIRIVRDDAGRKRTERPALALAPSSAPTFAGVTGGVTTTAHATASTPPGVVAAQPSPPAIPPLVKQLVPGHLLADELTRLLGRHPIVMATLGYARQKWHLPSRLPADGQYTAALIPAHAPGSRLQLAYLELDYHGRQERVYHYVDSQGRDLILGKRGEGYRILDPLLPVFDARVSSGWGWRTQPVLGGNEFHQGVDYAAPAGTPVHATMDGVVELSEWRANYGRLVEIKHPGNLSTRYAHLSAYATHIQIGSAVHRGQIIGYVGSSGLSTGPHLYYEVWDHGTRINPQIHQELWVTASLDARERRRFGDYVGRMVAP